MAHKAVIVNCVPKLVVMARFLSTARPHLTHDSYGPSEPITQTASPLVQPFLHRWPQSFPILYNGTPLSPSKWPIIMGGSGPRCNTWFLGPIPVHTQTIGSAISAGLIIMTDRPTVTTCHIYVVLQYGQIIIMIIRSVVISVLLGQAGF